MKDVGLTGSPEKPEPFARASALEWKDFGSRPSGSGQMVGSFLKGGQQFPDVQGVFQLEDHQ